uniref:alpha-1,6-mannosyl-glycoprotein 6-beta-N-acetylglucosaminyltransferase n=1 Tax=Oreochromis aureus TaxID=47969 RepID=A0A668RX15_OREAU
MARFLPVKQKFFLPTVAKYLLIGSHCWGFPSIIIFLQAQWESDPCYAFYGVDGTTCSILTYLSQTEDFCPPQDGRNHSSLPWHQKPQAISNNSSPAIKFIRSRVEKMSERWIQAGLRMKESSNNTVSTQMRVLLYPGALSGSVGQHFEAMVERGGPLGELVQWADLSACLTILGHNLVFSTSQHQLHSLIGAAPGRGSCPIQRPLTFDLIYTDYHGLAHLQGAMGLAFKHYQCRFRILDSFGTEPAFNFASYARSHGYKTLWGSWDLQPLQYMTMFRKQAGSPGPRATLHPSAWNTVYLRTKRQKENKTEEGHGRKKEKNEA